MVKIEGLEVLRRSLKRYAKDFPEETKKIIASETLKLQSAAKRSVPVDTGKLRQSILAEIKDDGFTGEVTANALYAAYVEFGTGGMVEIPEGWELEASKFKGKGKRQVNLPARPFLSNNFKKIRRTLTDKLRAEIRKIEK